MNQFILTIGGKEYRVKATTAAVQTAESRIGKSLLAAMETIDQTACFAAILWAGLQKFNHGMTLEKVYDLIDVMNDEGCAFADKTYPGGGMELRAELALEVLKVSGFFTSQQIERMESASRPVNDENFTA